MDQRPQYLAQVLEKIGAPLMKAITETPQPHAGGLQDDARIMAELLSKTVRTSIEIGKMIDLSSLPDHGDSMRVALAAITSGIVAGLYKRNGGAPGENDIKRIVTALHAVMTFSENFAPSPENIARLNLLEAEGQDVDAWQVSVQYLQTLTPVVNAIAAFPFGQPEQKLILDVAGRLLQKSAGIAASIEGLDPQTRKRAELSVLRAVAQIYSAAHEAETRRLMAMNEDQRMQHLSGGGGLSLDNVWKSFEERAALLEALARNIASLSSTGGKQASGGAAAPTPMPVQAPAAAAVPSQIPAPPVFTPPPAAEATAPAGFNPMSSFLKTPAATPPATPPAQATAPPSGNNPMAFFKPGAKNDDAS